MDGGAVTALVDRLRANFDDRISDYPSGLEHDFLADEFGRHVHAAAVAGHVDLLITQDGGFRGYQEIGPPSRLRSANCPNFAVRVLRHQQQLALE